MTSEEMSGDVAVTAQSHSDAAPGEQQRGEQPPSDAIESAANVEPDDQADGGGAAGRARDPWFEPEPTTAPPPMAGQPPADRVGYGVDYPDSRQAEWFLPTGRAGLLPDSMTESWDDDEPQESPAHTAAAGAPPWAADAAAPAAGGPRKSPGGRAPTAVLAGMRPPVGPDRVLGMLGGRRSGQPGEGGADRLAYWTAIALSVVWACVIAVIVATGSGSPA